MMQVNVEVFIKSYCNSIKLVSLVDFNAKNLSSMSKRHIRPWALRHETQAAFLLYKRDNPMFSLTKLIINDNIIIKTKKVY